MAQDKKSNAGGKGKMPTVKGLRASPPRVYRVEDLSERMARWAVLRKKYTHGDWLKAQADANDWERRYGHAADSWMYLLRLAMEACESGDVRELREYLR